MRPMLAILHLLGMFVADLLRGGAGLKPRICFSALGRPLCVPKTSSVLI